MLTASGFFSPQEIAIALELIEQTLQQGSDSGYAFLFADEPTNPGQLQGYSCYGPIPATVNSFDLYWIAVAPQQQGLGLGKKLLQSTEACVLAAGGEQLLIETSGREQSLPTRRFYQAMGYHISQQLVHGYGPGDDKITYTKHFPIMDASNLAAINKAADATAQSMYCAQNQPG